MCVSRRQSPTVCAPSWAETRLALWFAAATALAKKTTSSAKVVLCRPCRRERERRCSRGGAVEREEREGEERERESCAQGGDTSRASTASSATCSCCSSLMPSYLQKERTDTPPTAWAQAQGEQGSSCMCVCVCVCERERERESLVGHAPEVVERVQQAVAAAGCHPEDRYVNRCYQHPETHSFAL